jgi:hypothetical protein
MQIEQVLKKNKIKKNAFAKRAGYKSVAGLNYAINQKIVPLEDTLKIMLLEKAGINTDELIRSML